MTLRSAEKLRRRQDADPAGGCQQLRVLRARLPVAPRAASLLRPDARLGSPMRPAGPPSADLRQAVEQMQEFDPTVCPALKVKHASPRYRVVPFRVGLVVHRAGANGQEGVRDQPAPFGMHLRQRPWRRRRAALLPV